MFFHQFFFIFHNINQYYLFIFKMCNIILHTTEKKRKKSVLDSFRIHAHTHIIHTNKQTHTHTHTHTHTRAYAQAHTRIYIFPGGAGG